MIDGVYSVATYDNEKYREFGLWKRWPLQNIYRDFLRYQSGQITKAEFEQRKQFFIKASEDEISGTRSSEMASIERLYKKECEK